MGWSRTPSPELPQLLSAVPATAVQPTAVPVQPFTGLGSGHHDNVLRGAANMLLNLAELPEGSKTESAEAAIRSAVNGVVQSPDLVRNAIQELKGFHIEASGDIPLAPTWHKARAFVWLLGGHQAEGIAAAQLTAGCTLEEAT